MALSINIILLIFVSIVIGIAISLFLKPFIRKAFPISLKSNSNSYIDNLHYKIFFESAPDAIFLLKNNQIVYFNAKALEMLETDAKRLINKSPLDFSPEIQSNGETSIDKSGKFFISQGIDPNTKFDWQFITSKGKKVETEISISSFALNDEEYKTLIIRDVTQRKLTDEELFTYRLNLEILVSEKTADLETLNNALTQTNLELQKINNELEVTNNALINEIKQHSEIQNQLELSEEKYRSFILQSGIGIMLANVNGQIIEWNKMMEKYTGITKDAALNMYIWDIEYKMYPIQKQTSLRYEKIKAIVLDYLKRMPDAPTITYDIDQVNTKFSYSYSLTYFPIQTDLGANVGVIYKDITEKRKTEKDLEKYQIQLEELIIKRTGEIIEIDQRYREIFTNTSDAVFLIGLRNDKRYEFLSINPAMELLLAGNKAFNEGKRILDEVFPEKLNSLFEETIKQCIESSTTIEKVQRLYINNSQKVFKVLIVPIPSSTNEIYRIAYFARDITAEQNIREEQEFNSVLFNSIQNLIIVLDNKGRIIKFNNTCELISGYSSNEIIGNYYWDILFPDNYKPQAKNIFVKLLENENPGDNQSTWLTKTNGTRQVLWNYSSIKNTSGEAQFIIISGIDLTERLNMENALRESEEKFRNIFNNSLDGIAITNLDRYFIEANPMSMKKLGYSFEEIKHVKSTDLIPEKYHPELQKRLFLMLQGKELDFFETEVITKNKNILPVELNGKLIEYEGQPAILTLIRDITERKQLENQLFEIVIETEEKERRALASDLHDEIGPLLASLRMYASTLARKLAKTEYNDVLEVVQRLIKEAVERTREISNHLSPHLLETYGLEAAIKSEINNTSLILPVHFSSNLSSTRFERKVEIVIYRLVKELMNNTRKYANASKSELTLILNGQLFQLLYSDNGIGFDFNNEINVSGKGMGLQNIIHRVKSINGSYTVKTSPGEGFTFKLQCDVKIM